MNGDEREYYVDCIRSFGKNYIDILQLLDGIENGIIKEIRLPDGREYDVSKVTLVRRYIKLPGKAE